MAAMYEAEAKKGIHRDWERTNKTNRSVQLRVSELIESICFFLRLILGEIYELKAELNSDKRDRKKEAVKKVRRQIESSLRAVDEVSRDSF